MEPLHFAIVLRGLDRITDESDSQSVTGSPKLSLKFTAIVYPNRGNREWGFEDFPRTPEEINQIRRQRAEKYISTLPLYIRDDLIALAALGTASHLRTDIWGDRIPPGGVEKLKKAEQALREKLAAKYQTGDSGFGLDKFLLKYRLDDPEVKTVLAEQAAQAGFTFELTP